MTNKIHVRKKNGFQVCVPYLFIFFSILIVDIFGASNLPIRSNTLHDHEIYDMKSKKENETCVLWLIGVQ